MKRIGMPGILYRYITKEIVKAFLLSLFILTMIFFLVSAMQVVRKFSQYISFLDLITLSPYILLNAFAFTIPLSVLAATTLTYGRMSQDKEILILRCAGIHARKILRPALVVGFFLSIFCFYLNAEILPLTLRKQGEIKFKAMEVLLQISFSDQQTSIDFIPNTRIYYRRLSGGKFKHLVIQRMGDNQRIETEIIADQGKLLYDKTQNVLTFDLEKGSVSHMEKKKEKREERFFFDRLVLPFSLETVPKKEIARTKYKTFSTLNEDAKAWHQKYLDLEKQIQEGKHASAEEKKLLQARARDAYDEYVDHSYLWYNRIASALGPLLVVFLGTSLGLLIQHSNRLVAFGISALPILLIYYPLDLLGAYLANDYIISPFWGAWIANIVTGLIGIILLWVLYKK